MSQSDVSRRHRLLSAALAVFMIGLPTVLTQASTAGPAAAAPIYSSTLRLDVLSARDSTLRRPRGTDDCAPYRGMELLHPFVAPILPSDAAAPAGCVSAPAAFTYKWIINEDNTGNPHQASSSTAVDPADTTNNGSDVCHPLTATNPDGDIAFPDHCDWPSVHRVLSSPVVTQGDSSEWNLANAIAALPGTESSPRKYLVSVSADGFEIGGAHFRVPMPVVAAGPATIKVGLNPYPIPLGTIQVKVFQDAAPADGTFDATTEHGLAGWSATVNDVLPGQVSTDWYVNPICTEYYRGVPIGLDPSPPSPTMSPTDALAYYGVGGLGQALATAYYGGGNTAYIFSYDDYATWGFGMVDGAPVRVPGTGGKCLSDSNGIVRIPNMGTNRYSITVTPPGDLANQDRWSQTTTLEGGHDWDFWMMTNDSGLDSEIVQAGEPVPWAQFGFVDTQAPNTITDTHNPAYTGLRGTIKGTVMAGEPYVPGQGGLVGQGGANGQSGIRYSRPLDRVWIALNDFDNGDQVGYTTENNANGSFQIDNVKDGTYLMSVWDIDQDYAIDFFNVTVVGNQVVDLGNVPLLGWFTRITGHVFVDKNANGRLDPGEVGVPNFDVVIKNRTNDVYVSGQQVSTTGFDGSYHLKEGYPTGAFIIEEFFNTRYKTTGVTYQADNDPQEHTVLTGAVDISVNPIIGQDGRVDIGVLPYDPSAASEDNGGIVATVAYDATRNELQSRKAATEPYEPGIPDILVDIWAPVPCRNTPPCDPSGRYQLDGEGAFKRATDPLDPATLVVGDNPSTADVAAGTESPSTATYKTETWRRPAGCIPRDSNGNPIIQDAIKTTGATVTDQDCVEATMLGTTFGFSDGVDGQTVDGNYGFVTYHPGDYIVGVTIPNDPILGNPLYKVRTEDPINVFTGDAYVPQGADLNGMTFQDFLKANRADPSVPQVPSDGLREPASTSGPYPNALCVGKPVAIYADDPSLDSYNPDLHNVGGSPYEGKKAPSCQYKLIHVEAGQSVAPNFSLYTDVPIPAKYYGYVTDDVSVSTDRRSTALGEVQGVGDVPVGLYDWTNRLLTTVDTDPNGLFEVLMPSTNSYNCPVPAGPCAGMYRFVGNDPGQPQRPNLNYKQTYRTIAANFQAWPGVFTSADTAPTRATIQIEGPGSQFAAAVVCKADVTEPQLFRVDYPYLPNPTIFNGSNNQTRGRIEIYGQGFGATKGSLTLTNDLGVVTTIPAASLTLWTDTHITMSVLLSSLAGGAYQLHVTQAGASGGLTTVNGLTIHVLKSSYTTVASGSNLTFDRRFPDVVHVGPLSTLRRIHQDTPATPIASRVNESATTWSDTNVANMFTPTDPNQFYFPGPIQKAINYGWDRYLDVNPFIAALINIFVPPDQRPAMFQAFGAKDRHPLVVTYPRFDNDPVNGAPALDPVTGLASFDPDDPSITWNHNAAYYESPVLYYPGKIQGTGPGGIYPDTTGGATGPTPIYGSVVDGSYYNAATNKPAASTSDLPDATTDAFLYDPSLFAEPYAALWENFVVFRLGAGANIADPTLPPVTFPLPSWWGYGWDGQQAPTEGEVFYVLARNGDYKSSYKAAIDGLGITGGDQKGFPGNRNEAGGGRIANAPGQTGTAPDENFVLDIQGGAIMVNAFARFVQITNNNVFANSGASGAIRIGTPQLGTDTEDGNPETDPATGETFPTFDQQNTDLRLAFNRITANGGTSLAGAVGIFNGSERYRVDHNEFCGNFSAEYGGAISHFGLSKNGRIDHNKIYLNESVDEGAGIMIAGEPHLDPATAVPLPGTLSNGSGPVTIDDNYIAANLAGDDGGGIRFLEAGNWKADVYNNMITNNVSTHEGGGMALDNATNVRIYNNTIAKNITTATAVTSNGTPAPAGLASGDNSTALQNCNATPSRTGIRGRTTAGSAIFTLQSSAPLSSNFVVSDIGATFQAVNPSPPPTNLFPAGTMIVSVAAGGRSAVLSEPASRTRSNVSFSVFEACSGQPPYVGSSTFSDPLLFNNLFDDNRAGNWQSTGTDPGVHGIGLGGLTDINRWDMGTADGSGLLHPSSSIIDDSNLNGFTDDGTNNCLSGCGTTHVSPPNSNDPMLRNYPKFRAPWNLTVTVSPWRVNPRFRPTSIVGVSLPANAIGDYHLYDTTSPAFDTAADNKTFSFAPFEVVTAPGKDIDGDTRPGFLHNDMGADEIRPTTADLGITKTDGKTNARPGASVTYTVVVTNNGPDAVTGATVADTVPLVLTGVTWTCSASVGSSCSTAGGSGSINTTVNLLNGGTATFSVTGNVPGTASGTLSNTATVTAPSGVADAAGNNSATDVDTILRDVEVSITKTRSATFNRGDVFTYTIVASNTGLDSTTATVTDVVPAALDDGSWTCNPTGGATCPASGTRAQLGSGVGVTLPSGGVATFTVNVTAPALPASPCPALISCALPVLTTLDTFNRVDSILTGLNLNFSPGTNWSQTTIFGIPQIGVSSNQAATLTGGRAMWNTPTAGFGTKQAAAFTFAAAPVNESALILKATGGTTNTGLFNPCSVAGSICNPATYIRVRYRNITTTVTNTATVTVPPGTTDAAGNNIATATSTQQNPEVIIDTTTNSGGSFTTRGTRWNVASAGVGLAPFATGDAMTAMVDATGRVFVWKTTGTTTTYVGGLLIGSFPAGLASGRLGMQLPAGPPTRVDNFSGGTVAP